MSKSLGDYIVDRTESLDDEYIKKYFIDRNDGKIDRLLDCEQYLLEGSRGIGKTMLMKMAEITANSRFNTEGVLAVWVSFEESLRLERIQVSKNASVDPFLQWTMGKILLEILNRILLLKPACVDELDVRLKKIFNKENQVNKISVYINQLRGYVDILEQGDISSNEEIEEQDISVELRRILDNPISFKNFILQLCLDVGIERVVLLFDEAAHVFSTQQQEKFFTLFKSLRDPKIACKAAVYPGITNYGKYFEKGQDAKEMMLSWYPNEKNDIDYIKKILRERIQEYDVDYWNLLTRNTEVINWICICSNGNPRFAFHIIDNLDMSKAFSKKILTIQTLINCIRSAFDEKWREFSTLENRMPKYKICIKEAEPFIKNIVQENLKKWNNNKREKQAKLSAGFFVETSVYEKISGVFDVLAYANIISIDYSKKSIKQTQKTHYGYYMMLNPSILFTDLIIKSTDEMFSVSIAIENNQAYYETSKVIRDLFGKVKIEQNIKCSNSACTFSTNESFRFCPICGAPLEVPEDISLYKILRAHSIDNLKLSQWIIDSLKTKFSTIGELQDAKIDDIRMYRIQDVRIEKIKNAVTEYMAG